MKIEVKKLDKLKRTIKVEVSGEAFLKEKEEAFIQTGKKIRIAGFRPGTAPLDVLEKTHSGVLKDEFLKEAVPLYYQKAIEEAKLFPVILPRIYDVELLKDKVTFCAELEVKPEIELKDADYTGMKLKDIEVTVKDAEIKKVTDNLREGIKKVIEKDLDDEQIAAWAGYKSFDVFKDAINTEIKIEKLRDRKAKLNSQVTMQLLKNIAVEVSKTEVEKHHNELVSREVYRLGIRGVSQEDIDKYKKDIEEKLKPIAEDEIRLMYILEAIAGKENIKISDNLGEVVLGFIFSRAKYI